MEFPSIKLNIFKKLEYFLELRELNRKFDSQFEILKNKKWDNNRFKGAYPSWEIEKKVLFWTYSSHKYLGSPIVKNNFNDMLISEGEYNKIGVKKIFENLEICGFGKTEKTNKEGKSELQFFINSKGLNYGELLWYLYKYKKYKPQNSIPPKKYADIFQTNYKLTRFSLGAFIFYLQLISLYLFTIFAGLFLTFELLDKVELLDNFKNIVINIFYHPNILIFLLVLPIVLLVLSMILDISYLFFVVKNKYKNIDKI